jgi:membrane-bound lytic murein transglycosylase D
MTTPKDREFELHLPVGTKQQYETAIAAIPADKRVWWRYHKVQEGDTLASIARNYRTTGKAIAQANELGESGLEVDRKLIIPIASGKHALGEDTATYSRRATRYKTRKGDTVTSVADNFGVPPKMVRRWNRLKGDSLRGRRVIYVYLPISPGTHEPQVATRSRKKAGSSSAHAQVVHHKVKQGETLYSIATSYNTTISAIKRDNGKLAQLRPGMILLIRDSH